MFTWDLEQKISPIVWFALFTECLQPLADMPKCQMLFFFLKLWWAAVDKQPISFISKLFTRFTRHPELQDVTFSSRFENPLPFHRCCKKKKKKKVTVIEDRVSLFSKLQSATGGFTFHLDWLNSCLKSVVHPSRASACQSFYLTREAHCLIDI